MKFLTEAKLKYDDVFHSECTEKIRHVFGVCRGCVPLGVHPTRSALRRSILRFWRLGFDVYKSIFTGASNSAPNNFIRILAREIIHTDGS
jgi:hypothetical protein